MHSVLRAIVYLVAGITAAQAETLTIVADFKGPHDARSDEEMKREFATVMKASGLKFVWRTPGEVESTPEDNLVVVRFKGKCILEPVGYLYDERGPLAFTHSADGAILPFSEIACDHVTASVRSAMFGGDYARSEQLLGRALGRVAAHEVVHILTQSGDHGKSGVAQKALTGRQLISSELPLSSDDAKRLTTKRGH